MANEPKQNKYTAKQLIKAWTLFQEGKQYKDLAIEAGIKFINVDY